MKSDDPKNLIQQLRPLPITLPRHQAVLRKRLMVMHALQRRPAPYASRGETFMRHARIVVASHKIAVISLSIAGVLLVLGGLLLIVPTTHTPYGRKLVANGPIVLPAHSPRAPAATTTCNDVATCVWPRQVEHAAAPPPAASPSGVLATNDIAPAAPDATAYNSAPPTDTPTMHLASPQSTASMVSPASEGTATIAIPDLLGVGGKDKPKKDKPPNPNAAAKAAKDKDKAAKI